MGFMFAALFFYIPVAIVSIRLNNFGLDGWGVLCLVSVVSVLTVAMGKILDMEVK